ncbi:uncharacterized protein LOC122258028 [Penaeus japonicus]|uniref:uncharacterized protein LOC122258028 n=1 Tax=Penaeus japonicus TaxID=27405 RepID=UPI001C70F3D3|nr:uncharacterized protein LOC122258028 [Penaeus japonicus]XP_042879641.1 uncharacterized protein LOC122258028 [Penaeus japonicus]
MYAAGLVLVAFLITWPGYANAQMSVSDGMNMTATNATGNVNTSSGDTGTKTGDSPTLEMVMYAFLIILWLSLPFMSWGFSVPAAIVFRSIFVQLLGEDMFVAVFGGTGGSGPLVVVEDAFRGVFF